jgi:two-component system, NarL family, invasion response regulator UvrY
MTGPTTADARTAPVEVLVVDDQLPFRRAARALLTAEGRFTVVGEAGDGEEAVALVARLRPRLVVMDVRLPGIDGVEATRRILAEHPATVVVLVSTHRQADLPADVTTCGSAAFMPKEDFDAEALDALLAGR